MKLGITQLLPTTFAEIAIENIRQVRDLGFAGTAFNINDDPATISTKDAREFARKCQSEGVLIAEYCRYNTNFVNSAARAESLSQVREACRVAQTIDCPVVIVGIGSHNPAGNWFAHKDNFSTASQGTLIPALREAAAIAADAGRILALECHVTTTLRDAATARAVLEEIGAPILKVHLDPVNWMTFETILDSGPAIDGMYASLGPQWISGAHSKGATLADKLIVHMDEIYTGGPGDRIDHAAVLRGLAALPGDLWLVIEHLAVADMPAAHATVLAAAKASGLSFTGIDA
jgi:sugar phosphate isomerase/epimerase